MELTAFFKSMTVPEIAITVLAIAFLVIEVNPPDIVASQIDTPIGMGVLVIMAIYVFMSFHPILGVLFILVAYELLRRSSHYVNFAATVNYTPTQQEKEAEVAEMTPVAPANTLEEEIVNTMAPIGKSSIISYTTSEYSPVAADTFGASLI
jgi:hypothetical protein